MPIGAGSFALDRPSNAGRCCERFLNFGAAVAGPGRENEATVYQLDTDPALSPEEQAFDDGIVRIGLDKQVRDTNGIFNSATSSPALAGELTTAFDDLVNWAVNGVKPEGDDVLDPIAVAAPDFGCRFTPVAHSLVLACP